MPIVKRLIDQIGGTIQVESELGKGTVVRITISHFIATPPEPEQKESYDLDVLQGKHILICEDHPLNAKILVKLLERKELYAETAENGRIGVEMFQQSEEGHFAAVLMDIRMPEMDGLEAATAIRHLDRGDATEIPIIAVTANAFEEDVKLSEEAGMNAHLAKPVEPELLYETLAKAISLRRYDDRK